jgi:putative phosphoribosyl transferase
VKRFTDRIEAGERLATELAVRYGHPEDILVLGLPRGGVPVAAPIAARFEAPLDVLVVRKIGFPGQDQLAMGAVASGGIVVRNTGVIDQGRVGEQAFQRGARLAAAETRRLEREFRGSRDMAPASGRNVFLVDDGLATGSTMRAAIDALRHLDPASVVVAVPVGPEDTVSELGKIADEVVCLLVPPSFMAVGVWYQRFPQVTTSEVRRLLRESSGDEESDATGGWGDSLEE